jgi:predicted amidohydrolase
VDRAAEDGADLLVFPEYGRMELATLDGAEAAGDLERSLHAAARWTEKADALIDGLAPASMASTSSRLRPGVRRRPRPVNRASFFGPEGPLGHQDKQVMTRFEREQWNVVPGGPLRVFDTRAGPDRGADLLRRRVPASGPGADRGGGRDPAGPVLHRGAVGLFPRARSVPWPARWRGNASSSIPPRWAPLRGPRRWTSTRGGGDLRPARWGFPETGVLAQGDLNAPGWVTAEVDRAAVARVRRSGAVLGHAHWPESASRARVSADRQNSLENRPRRAHLAPTRAKRGAAMKE